MLDAWARGKRRSVRSIYEDELVSAVLGPLQYFPLTTRVNSTLAVLQDTFGDDVKNVTSHGDQVTQCNIQLWPNIVIRGRCEPDAVVQLSSSVGVRLILVIEAKWNAVQGDNQLSTQWDAATAQYRQEELRHIFLTKEPHSTFEMLGHNADAEHQKRLKSLTWARLGVCLLRAARRPDASKEFIRWVETVRAFLGRIGQSPFEGVVAAVERRRWTCCTNGWRFQHQLIIAEHPHISPNSATQTWRTGQWQFRTRNP